MKHEEDKQDVDEKKTLDVIHKHGMGCGNKIAEIAMLIHPDALLIVPLYRSCIVVEQSDIDTADGGCIIHTYADPHWLGREIDIDNLKSEDFHFIYNVCGDRQGAVITRSEMKERLRKN